MQDITLLPFKKGLLNLQHGKGFIGGINIYPNITI